MQKLKHTLIKFIGQVQSGCSFFHLEEWEMLHKQRIFKEGGQEVIFKNQSIPIYNPTGIPIPHLTRFGKENITGNSLICPVINRKTPFPFCYKSNVIISQRVYGAFSQEPLYIFQFYHIYQKFTSILILIECIPGN